MTMNRGVSLIASLREVSQLTGQVTRGLESPDLSLSDLLVSASDIVYDRLEGDGVDPTALESAPFKKVVAYTFLAMLAASGLLRTAAEDPESVSARYLAMADRFYDQAPTRTTGANDARRADEGLPALSNFEGGWVFHGGANWRDDKLNNSIPTSRNT